jgi:hypothetical protein
VSWRIDAESSNNTPSCTPRCRFMWKQGLLALQTLKPYCNSHDEQHPWVEPIRVSFQASFPPEAWLFVVCRCVVSMEYNYQLVW